MLSSLKKAGKAAGDAADWKKFASTAEDTVQKPMSGNALMLGTATVGGAYAASSMQESVSDRGSPTPGVTGIFSNVGQAAETGARELALRTAGVETPGAGLTSATFGASAGVGLATGGYQYFGSNTLVSSIRDQFEGKNVFDTTSKGPVGRLFGSSKASTAVKGGLNAAHRSMGVLGAAATATFAAAATASVIDRSTDRLAQKVLQTGTPGSRLSQNNMMKGNRSRSRRSQPTTSGVSRYAGRMQNVMDGSTVLALHKTGGRGAVLGG